MQYIGMDTPIPPGTIRPIYCTICWCIITIATTSCEPDHDNVLRHVAWRQGKGESGP